MALHEMRYARTEEEKSKVMLDFEEKMFKLQRIVTIIIMWCLIPFCLLCLAFSWWTAMAILATVWIFATFIWWVSIHVYKVGVIEDWWDDR